MAQIYKAKYGTVEYNSEYETFYAYDKESEAMVQFSMTKEEFKEMVSAFFNIEEA